MNFFSFYLRMGGFKLKLNYCAFWGHTYLIMIINKTNGVGKVPCLSWVLITILISWLKHTFFLFSEFLHCLLSMYMNNTYDFHLIIIIIIHLISIQWWWYTVTPTDGLFLGFVTLTASMAMLSTFLKSHICNMKYGKSKLLGLFYLFILTFYNPVIRFGLNRAKWRVL